MDPVVIVVVGTLVLGGLAVIAYGIDAVIAHHAANKVAHERRTDPAAPSTSGAVRAQQCNAHRPHDYRMTEDCNAYVCVRCGDKVNRAVPFDQEAAEVLAEANRITRGGVA